MRHIKFPLPFGVFVLGFSAVAVAACGGGAEKTAETTDSTAAAAVAPPPAESFALSGDDSSWAVDITPGNIAWRTLKGKKDSIMFDYKAPSVNGAITEFTSIRMAADTHRIDITLAMVPCTDKKNNQYTHKAQVWVDQKPYTGCAVKK